MSSEERLKLAREVKGRFDVLLQLLLLAKTSETLDRILDCPRYPVPARTNGAIESAATLHRLLVSNPRQASSLLGFLFAKSTGDEKRKQKGQYFTPSSVADWLAKRISVSRENALIDAGCGAGALGLALLFENRPKAKEVAYVGVEFDPALALACALALEAARAPTSWRVLYHNFLTLDRDKLQSFGLRPADVVVANPPFIRYQRMSGIQTTLVKLEAQTGVSISGFAGSHSYFVAKASSLLGPEGRMFFLLPSEVGGTSSSLGVLQKMASRFSINKLEIPRALPHAGTNGDQSPRALHTLIEFLPRAGVLPESAPFDPLPRGFQPLSVFARVRRGISTGSNEFFVLDQDRVERLRLNTGQRKRVIPTKVPLPPNVFDESAWETLRREGRPCWLLYLPKETKFRSLSSEVREHVQSGMAEGIHLRTTSRKRSPWYSVELPPPPDLLFTYMSRAPRFVVNAARAYILTNLLGVYLKSERPKSSAHLEKIAEVLSESMQLWLSKGPHGRRYRDGLLKFEPGDLLSMPVPVGRIKPLLRFEGDLEQYDGSASDDGKVGRAKSRGV